MADYTRHKKWHRWVGGATDLAQAMRTAIETLTPLVEPGGSLDASFELELSELTVRGTTPEEIEGLAPKEAVDVREAKIEVYFWSPATERQASVEILATRGLGSEDKRPAMRVDVFGRDRTQMEGLAARLIDMLGEGGRVGSTAIVMSAFALGGVLAALWAYIVIQLSWGDSDNLDGAQTTVLVLGVLGLVIGHFAGATYLTPQLEVLAPGGTSLMRRFRGFLFAFCVAVVAGVVSGLILYLR